MDKKRLLQEIIDRLRQTAKTMQEAAEATHAEATHEDNKAENKYDTRGLEASYLAEGQARQAEEAEANLLRFENLPFHTWSENETLEVGALVEIEMAGFRDLYLCGPGAGGMEIELDGEECTILTRESPMGRQVFGARVGDTLEINGRNAKIVSAE
jgi:hypothetical protein